jgi:hypothetical protein
MSDQLLDSFRLLLMEIQQKKSPFMHSPSRPRLTSQLHCQLAQLDFLSLPSQTTESEQL